MSDRVVHLIMITKDSSGVACTPDWVGKRMTNDVNQVTCQSCVGTDHYKKKAARVNGN